MRNTLAERERGRREQDKTESSDVNKEKGEGRPDYILHSDNLYRETPKSVRERKIPLPPPHTHIHYTVKVGPEQEG